jgi:S1-C subfamily serine protease
MAKVIASPLMTTMLALGLIVLAALLPVHATEERANPLTPALLDAVVHVETRIPPDARTASYLGTEREGSGVVIDSDGLIVTIGYLVMEAMAAQVTGPDGKTVLASVVGFDNESGLGLLRANEKLGVKPLRIGSASGLHEKTPALVASASDTQPVIVTSRRSFAGYWEYLLEDAIFTAPPIEDWGGAALIGADGRLLGIGSLLVPNAIKGADPHPGNMFVPIDLLEPVLADLLTTGRPSGPARPWLGLNLAPSGDGLVVMRVSADGPAKKAGIERGDRVLAVAGQPIRDLADFYRKVWAQGAAGVAVPLTVEQDSIRRELSVPSIDRYRYLKLNTSY